MLQNKTCEILVEVSQDKKYPVFIDDEPIINFEEKIFKYTKANKILFVVSEKVNKLYKNDLKFKNCVKYVLKDGENQKNFTNYQKI